MTARHASRFAVSAAAAVAALLAFGCESGPKVSTNVDYAGGGVRRAAEPTPIALRVTDMRPDKGRVAKDGREVIAEGDKGAVYLDQPIEAVVRKHMTTAFGQAGMPIDPNATVIVEAQVIDLSVEAYEFTHFNIPRDRASTLDALAALMPGPMRPTIAETTIHVMIRKHDQRTGFSYVVKRPPVVKKSRNSAIVSAAVSEAVSAAITEAVNKATPDVALAAKLPVTDQELSDENEQLVVQQRQLQQLETELGARERQLAGDRADLDRLRGQFETDRALFRQQKGQVAAARKAFDAERVEVEKQRAALAEREQFIAAREKRIRELESLADNRTTEQENELAGLKEQIEQKQAEVGAQRDAVAKLEAELNRRIAEFNRRNARLADKESDYDQAQKNLQQQQAALRAEEQAAQKVKQEVERQQRELAEKEKALAQWDEQLKERAAEAKKPPEKLIENMKPMIAVVEPQPDGLETSAPRVTVKGIVLDDHAITDLRFSVNGKAVGQQPRPEFAAGAKGIRIEMNPTDTAKAVTVLNNERHVLQRFEFTANLKSGKNTIGIDAWDNDGEHVRQEVTVQYKQDAGRVFIVAVGINRYRHVPQLRYAVADAKLIAETFQKQLDVPESHVELLLDEAATLQDLKHVLGVKIKARAARNDMVIIFFSGHGAPEDDPNSPDQDGVEKYLLPVDADLASFYSTALPMKDVQEIFRRLAAERVVFIADTCYSGAAGGDGARTTAAPGKTFRAIRIESVVKRLGGTGRIVLTASKGTEISQEKDALKHGVFSYYVARGLAGKADKNRDGLVTATELYEYVSVEVPKATANNQNPLMSKDDAVGEIILGRVK